MPCIKLLLASLLLLLAASAWADSNRNMQIGAQILDPMELKVAEHLHFATLVIRSEAGKVTLNPDGSLVFSDQAHYALGTPQAARIQVNGAPHQSYHVKQPPATVLTNASGHTLLLESATLEGGAERTFNAEGLDEFRLGATLVFSVNQPPGQYKGSLTLILSHE